MYIYFSASQSVELAVPELPIPIQHYLRQPQRLIKALVDPSRIEQLSPDSFRLKMRPLHFMTLNVQPTVDMQILVDLNGTLRLKSTACEIRGVEYVNQRFSLKLVGQLAPQQIGQTTYLSGRADLQVQIDLPPPFMLTPKPILETTGNGLLRSVLLSMKQRLAHQLLSDYRSWVAAQLEEVGNVADPSALFSANNFSSNNSAV